MKKVIAFIIIVLLSIVLAGCAVQKTSQKASPVSSKSLQQAADSSLPDQGSSLDTQKSVDEMSEDLTQIDALDTDLAEIDSLEDDLDFDI